MTQKRKDLPQPSASNFQQRLREALQTYMGRQGDPLDRGITLRDLLDTGLAKLRDGATLGIGSSTPPIAPIPVDIPVYEADLTPPPQPDGFAVSAAISHVFIEHNPPTYTQGHGHLRTRVYGAIVTPALPMPVFTDAVEVSQFSGTIHAHPSNPATTWRLWIKWESADGVLSATPAGGTNGLLTTTGQDVSLLLDALSGSITSTELASSLATPIALINQPTTGIVARLDAQTTIIGTLQTEVAALSGTPDYEAGVTYATDDVVQYDGGLYRALSATTGNLPTNATYWQKIGDYASLGDAVAAHAVQLEDHDTRIELTEAGLVAEAAARTVLASTVDGNTAAISAEASTRASETGALSTTITAVSAVANSKIKTYVQTTEPTTGMTAGDLWFDSDANNRLYRYSGSAWIEATDPRIAITAAAVTTETKARVDGDDALASQITTLIANSQANVGITRRLFWGFNTSTEDWVPGNALLTSSGGILTWTPTVANPTLAVTLPTGDRFTGSAASLIRARVRRISGTGAWEGNAYYTTAVHGISANFRKTIPAPTDPSQWNELEWDMAALTVGGTDWMTGEIRGIRLDLVSDASTSVWEVDWVAIGLPTVTPLSAALQIEADVRARETGELYAQYTVKTDVAGLVSGYGLASTANNAAPTSSFGVRASNFFVAPPSVASATAPTENLYKGFVWLDTSVTPNVTRYWTGSAWVTTPQVFPFVIQTSPTTINGVEVPPGVYIENAYMAQLVATRGQIGILAVDDARIASVAADKLVAGSIAVGEYIQATGYVAGSDGWRINGDGTAEFSGVVVRGTIYASAGLIGGSTIGSTYIRSNTYVLNESGWSFNSDGTGQVGGIAFLTNAMQSSNYVAGSAGWRLTRAGVFEANSGIFRGAVSGSQFTTGTFTSYSWPAFGTGTYLGPDGLRIGNFSSGRYFEVSALGNIAAPGFTVVNGVLTISQANVINTLNLAGNAVSVTGSATGTGATVSVAFTVPAGQTWNFTCLGFQTTRIGGSNTSGDSTLSITGASTAVVEIVRSVEDGTGGVPQWVHQSASVVSVLERSAGTHTFSLTGFSGTNKSIVVIVTKR